MSTSRTTAADTSRRPDRAMPAGLTWFAVIGGVVAWSVHLFVAWSVTEVSCIAPEGSARQQRGGSLGSGATLTAWLGTALPWLVAVGATVACIALWRRHRQLAGPDARTDELVLERTGLLLVLGIFLDLMTLAAITAGGIALLVLEPCT